MDAQRWHYIQDVFHEALDQPEAGRTAWLEARCAQDTALRDEVLSLLDEDARRTGLLERGLNEVAAVLVAGGRNHQVPGEIGPYRIVRLLGEGGMGVVWLAERSDIGLKVAIKILPNAWMSPARSARFTLEQRALARLNHRNIARLYDAGVLEDGTPWFAMEYVEGVPLTRFGEERQLSLRDRLELFRAVCDAVGHAHDQALLHRDLKPSNILVRADGEPRLLDFGIACDLERRSPDAPPTMPLATPDYAAPEQLTGKPPAVQADVYSLGVILYELLTGVRARPGNTGNRFAARVALRKLAGAESRGTLADLEILCRTAMEPQKERRYRSVAAFAADIDRFIAGEPLEARGKDVSYRISKFVTRRWRLLAAAASAAAILLITLGYFTWRLSITRDEAVAEAARARRMERFLVGLFQGGDAQAGPSRDLRALDLLERGAREAEALNADPAAQADLFQSLGEVFENLGKFDRSEELIRRALDLRRQHGATPARLAENLVALGLVCAERGDLSAAEQLVNEGLQSAVSALPASHPTAIRAQTALGRLLMDRGKYADSIVVLRKALALQPETAPPSQDRADTLLRLANSEFYSAHYDVAEQLNQQVVAIYRQLYGEQHPRMADPVINLGAVAQQRSQYADAERLYRQAYEIHQAWYGESHPETAASLMGVARALVSQKKPEAAEPLLRQVLGIREKVYGPVHPNVASTLSSLGAVWLGQSRFHDAEEAFRRMAAIYRQTSGERHHFVGLAIANLGSVYLKQGDHSQAERCFREALAIYESALPADHFDVGVTRIKLGRTLTAQRRYVDARPQLEAGLGILEQKTRAPSTWADAARGDLALIAKVSSTVELAHQSK